MLLLNALDKYFKFINSGYCTRKYIRKFLFTGGFEELSDVEKHKDLEASNELIYIEFYIYILHHFRRIMGHLI
jgi:hypothetical protein